MGQDAYAWGPWAAGQQAEEPLGLAVLGRAPLCFGKGPFGAPVNGQEKEGEEADTTSSPCARLWALGEMAKMSYSSLEETPWIQLYIPQLVPGWWVEDPKGLSDLRFHSSGVSFKRKTETPP